MQLNVSCCLLINQLIYWAWGVLVRFAGGPYFAPKRGMFSPSWISQLIEDGKAPPPEGGLWGTNESTPVALWPDPDDGSKADLARAVPKERVSGLIFVSGGITRRLSSSFWLLL